MRKKIINTRIYRGSAISSLRPLLKVHLESSTPLSNLLWVKIKTLTILEQAFALYKSLFHSRAILCSMPHSQQQNLSTTFTHSEKPTNYNSKQAFKKLMLWLKV
ncbi:hypothetical protein MANES_17G023147v8 [Manihot esculenta]|uniref:Uncharacterized protein n=1 Tax=Manihot esculenta TaxID=3983 RepID=A0ACB7G1W8_MANES|nr:hypothetical protein MANES_17G023147v8 [Manihot esculenta]